MKKYECTDPCPIHNDKRCCYSCEEVDSCGVKCSDDDDREECNSKIEIEEEEEE